MFGKYDLQSLHDQSKSTAKFELELEIISADVEAFTLDEDSVEVAAVVSKYIAKNLQAK